MKIDVRKREDVAIVDFEGSLVAGDAVDLFANRINEVIAEGCKKILVNLSQVDYVDSTGLGELVQSYKLSRRFGADLHLLQPHERVRATLTMTKLLPLFPTHETEDGAVESLQKEEESEVSESE